MPDLSQLQVRIASALAIPIEEAGLLASRLVPTILVDDIQQVGDSADTATRYVIGAGSASGAANLAQVSITLPAATGTRLIVTGAWISSDTAGRFVGGLLATITALTTARAGAFRDSGLGVLPAGQVREGNAAAAPITHFNGRILANQLKWIPLQIVLDPGREFRFAKSTTAETLEVTFLWKEVKLPRIA